MGKTGPQSGSPSGYGTVSKKGYLRVWDIEQQRYRMEHDMIWEQHNGPIPDSYQIHHENENKLDNRIENLRLLDPLTHKRIHGRCELRNGLWWKPCKVCGEFKL